jgi:hypothetical protein
MDSQITPSIEGLWQIVQQQRAVVEDQTAKLAEQSAKLEEQSRQMAELRSRAEKAVARPREATVKAGTSRKLSRAGLLKAAAIGVAATTVAGGAELMGGSKRALADGTEGPTLFVGSDSDSFAVSAVCNAPGGTSVDATGPGSSESSGFYAVSGTAYNGVGVHAVSTNGTAVRADSAGGAGVQGTSSSGTGVIGKSSSTASNASAILGEITSTSPGGFSAGVRGQNDGTSGLGIGVWGSQNGAGWGGYFTSASGIGVNVSGGSGTGVNASGNTGVNASGVTRGVSASGGTQGVYGATGNTAANASAIQGEITSSTPGAGSAALFGKNDGTTGNGYGVEGTHAGGGWGGYFTSVNGIGMEAQGGTDGVRATSVKGRGAVLAGGVSQMRLVPAGASSHPLSGQAGDFFVDKAKRIWFCVGGTHWKQVKLV